MYRWICFVIYEATTITKEPTMTTITGDRECTYVHIGQMCNSKTLKKTGPLRTGIDKSNVKDTCCADNSCYGYFAHPSNSNSYVSSIRESLSGVDADLKCSDTWPIYRKDRGTICACLRTAEPLTPTLQINVIVTTAAPTTTTTAAAGLVCMCV